MFANIRLVVMGLFIVCMILVAFVEFWTDKKPVFSGMKLFTHKLEEETPQTSEDWYRLAEKYKFVNTKNGYIDLMNTIKVPVAFLPAFKNPCWYEEKKNNEKMLRCLPYFYFLGISKCGTSDIHASLTEHLPISRKNIKENYWISRCHFNTTNKRFYTSLCSSNFGNNFSKYLDVFQSSVNNIENEYVVVDNQVYHPMIIGDFTADVFYEWAWTSNTSVSGYANMPYRNTAELLYMMNPKSKLLVSLRNPIDRTYSAYYQGKPHLPSAEKFHERVVKSIAILKECEDRHPLLRCISNETLDVYFRQRGAEIQIGIYYIYLQEWLRIFPREQIHIVKFDEYVLNRTSTVIDIYIFLNLNITHDLKVKRKSKINATAKGKMLQETREMLVNFYKQYNKKLAELLHDNYFSSRWQ